MKSSARLVLEIFTILALCGWAVFAFSSSGKDKVVEKVVEADRTDWSPNLKVYNQSQAYDGYTLLPVEGVAEVAVLDMKGKQVHSWHVDVDRARLLPNCHLLAVHGSKWGVAQPEWDKLRPFVREYDWDGNVVWEYEAPDVAHHDISRLENGNTIFLHRSYVPKVFKQQITDPYRKSLKLRADSILEVDPAGKTVWHWNAYEHLDLNSCGKPTCERYAELPQKKKKLYDWTHMNTVSPIPENKWYRMGDKRFKPGNIITIPRNWWTVKIIDKETKEIVWDYEGDYEGGLGGGHEAYMIPEGYPGAGNILIFDNGSVVHPDKSYVLEINPVTKQTVWIADLGEGLFSRAAGAAQRLPNGNTLISEDKTGRVLEITPELKTVWEYQSDYETNRAKRYDRGFCSKLN